MSEVNSSRRSLLKALGAAGALAAGASRASAVSAATEVHQPSVTESKMAATRESRMRWWHQAKFGMFIHWGL